MLDDRIEYVKLNYNASDKQQNNNTIQLLQVKEKYEHPAGSY